jgi:hypothetical protein
MTQDNTLTSIHEQDYMDNDPTLQYFTAIRHQEPEYEDLNFLSKVMRIRVEIKILNFVGVRKS